MFKLNEKVLRHDPEDESRLLINLPVVGEIPVLLIYREKKIEKELKKYHSCDFLKKNEDEDDYVIQIAGGWIGSNASGAAIITMHQMGYDLTNKDDLKKAKKSDKEKIKNEYKKLLKEQPELFGENDTEEEAPVEQDEPKAEGKTDNERLTKCCGAPFSDNSINNMCSLCYKVNAEVLEPGEPYCYLKLNYSMGEDVLRGRRSLGEVDYYGKPNKAYLPNGELNVLLIKPSGLSLPVRTCNFFGLSTSVVQLNGGGIFGMDACGDALITIKDMDYDLSTKEGIKKAKKDKDKIKDHYEQLKKENLSLFTAQAEEIRQEKEDDKRFSEEMEQRELQEEEELRNNIIQLLKDKAIKMPVSDINAHLKFKDIDKIKEKCEEMYENDDISFAGNGRYFVLTEGQEKPKKTSAPKSEEVDVEKELEKLKGLLDKGLITQEQYDAKSNELLGL